jgi:hypothetical protein
MWKQRIISSLWWLLAIVIGGLLTAGYAIQKAFACSDITVNIDKVKGHVFINEKEITQLLKKEWCGYGKPHLGIPLQQLEYV